MFIKWRREERQIIGSKEKCSSNQTLFSYLDTPINAVKEPSLPICLSCQIEPNLDPKQPFFTTLGGEGDRGLHTTKAKWFMIES